MIHSNMTNEDEMIATKNPRCILFCTCRWADGLGWNYNDTLDAMNHACSDTIIMAKWLDTEPQPSLFKQPCDHVDAMGGPPNQTLAVGQ